MTSLPRTTGLRHVALNVVKLEACRDFYVGVLGMRIEWQPDEDNVYLTGGFDNLALHRASHDACSSDSDTASASDSDPPADRGRLDHIGFLLDAPEDVDLWHDHMIAHSVPILKAPKTHRDGARSFYCEDPDGVCIQMIYHPPLARGGPAKGSVSVTR